MLDLFGIAFTAGAINLIAGATYLDVFKGAVASAVVVFAGCYVASYIFINVFHKITSAFILPQKAQSMYHS